MVTTIRLPDELQKNLKERAEKRGMTLNAYLISILWNQQATENGKKAKGGRRYAADRIKKIGR